jgi:hypothetical protein
VLRAHCEKLLGDAQLAPAFAKALRDALARAAALAETAAREGGDVLARQAASALYHCTSAIAMAWEATGTGSAARLRWAQLVLLHRVLPRDPLAPDAMPRGLEQRRDTRRQSHCLIHRKNGDIPLRHLTFLLATATTCAALLTAAPAAQAQGPFPRNR